MKRFCLYIPLALLCTSCMSTMGSYWNEAKTTWQNLKNIHNQNSSVAYSQEDFFGADERDFIPLNDRDVTSQLVEYAVPQAREVPGTMGGLIPGIDAFRSPNKNESAVFTKIYFPTNQHISKTKESTAVIHRIANYLKKHPNLHVFIEGHADERASESYNLSLGTRRSNYVRQTLSKNGVNPQRLVTVSCGKEKPEALGHGEKFWAKNRRVAFKLYEKKK